MGIYLMIFMGGSPLGSPLVGGLAALIGIRGTILVCGVIVLVAAIVVRRLYIDFNAKKAA